MPPVFEYHPFQHIDFKEQAYIRKQPSRKTTERVPGCSSKFFMDFGFMRASSHDYRRPNKATDQIVQSYNGYSAYLIIIDSASRQVWAFLMATKAPPIAIMRAFLMKFGLVKGVIRTNQGGKLARSKEFRAVMMNEFNYTVEPTCFDNPLQNDGAEIYNGTLAVKVRMLLYGSGLPAKFWSAALLHSVYLHNRLVHSAVGITPYEGWYGRKPDVTYLKTFRLCMCVRQLGSQCCKLDHHNFTGIFPGYTATNQNIIYLNTTSGIVKSCHHAVFDEAWYLQTTRPLAAQLLYDLGLKAEEEFLSIHQPLPLMPQGTITLHAVPWPPLPPKLIPLTKWFPLPRSLYAPLPLRMTDAPTPLTARAAQTHATSTTLTNCELTSQTVINYLIGPHNMETIYLSDDPYGRTFEEPLDLRKCNLTQHLTAGLRFIVNDGRLILASINASTPSAKIDMWHYQLWGTWLVSIDDTPILSVAGAQSVF
jgi:hypothetical protein